MKILKFFGFDRRNRSPIQENKSNPPSKKEEVPISPAIAEHGVSPYHRMTFNLLGDGQLSLEF